MRSDNQPKIINRNNQQSGIIIKKDHLKTEQKGNNETKCEKSKIGKKGERRCRSNEQNRNQRAETRNNRLGGFKFKLKYNVKVKMSNYCNYLNYSVVGSVIEWLEHLILIVLVLVQNLFASFYGILRENT